MSSTLYEIELVASHGGDYLASLLATVTGLPKAEIQERLPEHLQKPGGWRGSSFVEVARLLGYNCNRQFKPFEARTSWPCILRCQSPELKPNWWALAYANGAVYDPWQESITWLDDFVRFCPEVKITSMLQIWIA
jgi:hypothetical protein